MHQRADNVRIFCSVLCFYFFLFHLRGTAERLRDCFTAGDMSACHLPITPANLERVPLSLLITANLQDGPVGNEGTDWNK